MPTHAITLTLVILTIAAVLPAPASAQPPAGTPDAPLSADEIQEQRWWQLGVGGVFGRPTGVLGDTVGWTGGVAFEYNRTLGIGAGAGVSIRTHASAGNVSMIDIRLRYLHAGAATYLSKTFELTRASTHVLQGYVGLTIF